LKDAGQSSGAGVDDRVRRNLFKVLANPQFEGIFNVGNDKFGVIKEDYMTDELQIDDEIDIVVDDRPKHSKRRI